jgi:hypothetical protein
VIWLGVVGSIVRAEDTRMVEQAKAETVRVYGLGLGRFDVVALPGPDGVRLAELAKLAWVEWMDDLGLPAQLTTGITVRLTPAEQWDFAEPHWRVVVEPGGIVSVWLKTGDETGMERDRRWLAGLAEGAMRRLAVLTGAEVANPRAPAWLTVAAAEAVLVAEQPSMLDAWRARMAAAESAPALRDLLYWADAQDKEAGEARRDGAYGLWLWLREDATSLQAWARFSRALLGGAAPGAVLAKEYAKLARPPSEAKEWDLSWATNLTRLMRARTTPLLEAGESRRWLERLARIVVLDTEVGGEAVLAAGGDWGTRGDAWLGEERTARTRLLMAEFGRMHPFYRNAAGSLGRAWSALAAGDEAGWRRAEAEWRADMADGAELEAASARALDAAEAVVR